MLSLNRNIPDQVTVIPTRGDGNNCLFFAFNGAFWTPENIEAIEVNLVIKEKTPAEAFAPLLELAEKKGLVSASATKSQQWETLKEKALRQHRDSAVQLSFALMMREFSVSLIEKDVKARKAHCENTLLDLSPTYREYVLKKIAPFLVQAGVSSDISESRPFIRNIFNQLLEEFKPALKQFDFVGYDKLNKNKHRTEKERAELNRLDTELDKLFQPQYDKLTDIWKRDGHQMLLSKMKENGQQASVDQLLPLLEFFNATGCVYLAGKHPQVMNANADEKSSQPIVLLTHNGSNHWSTGSRPLPKKVIQETSSRVQLPTGNAAPIRSVGFYSAVKPIIVPPPRKLPEKQQPKETLQKNHSSFGDLLRKIFGFMRGKSHVETSNTSPVERPAVKGSVKPVQEKQQRVPRYIRYLPNDQNRRDSALLVQAQENPKDAQLLSQEERDLAFAIKLSQEESDRALAERLQKEYDAEYTGSRLSRRRR